MAMELLDHHPSVDIHAHPGRFHRDGTGLDARILEMNRGGLSAGFFCVSTDRAIIRRDREAGRIRARRAFEPGESYRDTYARFAVLDPWFAEGRILRVLGPADILRAKRAKRPGAILAAEGADFLEERIDRVQGGPRSGHPARSSSSTTTSTPSPTSRPRSRGTTASPLSAPRSSGR